MSSFGLSMRVKQHFFDRKKVRDQTDRAERKVLSRAGAFIRRRARSSIRRRKKSSKPGQPPSAHVRGNAGIKNILFAYDERSRSVVVGPVKLNGKAGDAPRVLEEGGTTSLQRRRGKKRVKVQVAYPAFPYMGPALEAELPKLPPLWRDSVRG
ncbi:MAG: hypothetical protein RIC55_24380 [Pirellulaceae bacterium]